MNKPLAQLARLRRRLADYGSDVQRSREQLSESTQDQVLPPIPPQNHHSKRVGSTRPER